MKHFSRQDSVSDAREAYPAIKSLETENTTYSGIGAELYAARLRAGLELSDISQRLRIRLQHLESIERGAFDEIPGRIYAIGFLRTYAEYLGFDGDDMVSRFKAETGGGAAPTRLVFPSPAPESRMPGTAIIIVALILAAAAYGVWYYMHDIQRIATELVSEVPARLSTDTSTTNEQTATSAVASESSAAVITENTAETASDTAMSTTGPASGEAAVGSPTTTKAAPADAMPMMTAETRPATIVEQQPAPEPVRPEPVAAAPAVSEAPSTEATAEDTTMQATAEMPSATERMAALPTPSEPVETSTLEASTAPAAPTDETTDTAANQAPAPAPLVVASAPPLPPAAPASQPFSDGDAPQEYGISNTDARVVLRARYDCWVQVRGANNEQFLTKVLRAGDTYHVPNRADVRLFASDAGALELLVDGQTIPPIGGPGEIVRDVSLAAGTLLNRG